MKPGVGERAGELAEDRNAGRRGSSRSAGPEPPTRITAGNGAVGGRGGLRQRAGEREAVCGNADVLVVRPRDGDLPRRHRRDVVARDVECSATARSGAAAGRFRRPRCSGRAAACRRRDRHVRPACGDQARRRLDLLGHATRRRAASIEATRQDVRRESSSRRPPSSAAPPALRTAAKNGFGRKIAAGLDRVGLRSSSGPRW